MKFKFFVIAFITLIGSTTTVQGIADDVLIGLVTKTESNPFFVKMKEGAMTRAAQLGVELRTYTGLHQGDAESQIDAINNLIAAGAKGILITPADPALLAKTVTKAREAGVLVIALDTPFDPVDLADGTFATDNFKAGELIGTWARTKLGDKVSDAKVVTLDLSAEQITVDVMRNQGFLYGLGVELNNPKRMYDENDPRIVGSYATYGTIKGGREAMEYLLRQNPEINLVHTINEPAAFGAYQAIAALGLENRILIVSVDGGCEGVRHVVSGAIRATAMQYPLKMAALGIEAVVAYVNSGKRPVPTAGLDFFDTGTTLVTNDPIDGIESISAEQGLKECWG